MGTNARQGLRDSAAVLNGVLDSTALRSARMAVLDALARDIDLVVITGEPGCGKSVLLQAIEHALRNQRQPVRMLRGAADANRFRTIRCDEGRAILLIDDADQLDAETLHELLLYIRRARAGRAVLAGTAALQARLSDSTRGHRTCSLRLGVLLRQEIEQFIANRLAITNAVDVCFEQEALDRAYALTRGIPARLDRLCICVLALHKDRIDASDVERAVAFCEMARLASIAAPAAPVPKRRVGAEYIAAGVAAAIGIALGALFLIATVGVPQAAESAAKLIRALHPAAPTETRATTTQLAIPVQLTVPAMPQDEPATAGPRGEPGSGMIIELQPQPDPPDESMPEPDDSASEAPSPDDSPEAAPEDPNAQSHADEGMPDVPATDPAPSPTAEEPAPAMPVAEVPATSGPAITAPQAQSGMADPRGSDEPSPPAQVPPPVTAPVSREPAGAVNPAVPIAPRPTVDTGPLMARGTTLLREGDIAAARLFFQRAAAQGDSAAMMALGRTFDPLELRALGVLGLKGDPDKALEWYRAAANAGDPAAQPSMSRLSEWIERPR